MRELLVTRPGNLRDKNEETRCLMSVEDVPEPQLQSPTDVKIKVAYCSICGSDPHCAENDFCRPLPYGMGHEISGVIVEMGEGVNTKGLKVGDKVAGNFLRACGRCYNCQNGHPEFCKHAIDEGTAPGYAQYVVWDESQVWKVPDDMPLSKACFLEPVSVAVRITDRAAVKAGQRCAVQGGGPIGLFCMQLLKMHGATSLTMIEPNADRRDFAQKCGADFVIDPMSCDVAEECMKITEGMGYDVIIDAAGVAAIAEIPLKIAADGGTIMYVAMYDKSYCMPVPMANVFHGRNLTLTSTIVSPFCFPRAVQILSRMDLSSFSTAVFPLEEINAAFDTMLSNKYMKVIVCCNEDLKDR